MITGGIIVKEMSTGFRKAQIRQLSQVMAARELKPLVGPTVTFGPEDIHPLQAPHNDPLVVQLKIATAMVQQYWWTQEVRWTSSHLSALKVTVYREGLRGRGNAFSWVWGAHHISIGNKQVISEGWR